MSVCVASFLAATELNISRQAVIKTLVRFWAWIDGAQPLKMRLLRRGRRETDTYSPGEMDISRQMLRAAGVYHRGFR